MKMRRGLQTNILHIMQHNKEIELIPRRKKICWENSLPMEKRRFVIVPCLVTLLRLIPTLLSYMFHHQIVKGNNRAEGVGVKSLRNLPSIPLPSPTSYSPPSSSWSMSSVVRSNSSYSPSTSHLPSIPTQVLLHHPVDDHLLHVELVDDFVVTLHSTAFPSPTHVVAFCSDSWYFTYAPRFSSTCCSTMRRVYLSPLPLAHVPHEPEEVRQQHLVLVVQRGTLHRLGVEEEAVRLARDQLRVADEEFLSLPPHARHQTEDLAEV